MKVCVVGIGGCGGAVAECFLQNQDILGGYLPNKLHCAGGYYKSFGNIRGLWIEAAKTDAISQKFFGPLGNGCYPGYIIPKDAIIKDESLYGNIRQKYGFDVLGEGFFSKAEPLKAINEIFDIENELGQNPMMNYAWSSIQQYTTLSSNLSQGKDSSLCDSMLFVISLGGGTGTGFINPVTKKIREKAQFPVFVLGILTEGGKDQRHVSEDQRSLSATISMYDLITKRRGGEAISGLILVDNQILTERFQGDYHKIDNYIFEIMRPFLESREYPKKHLDPLHLDGNLWKDLKHPAILVPCHCADNNDDASHLVRCALENPLFNCNPAKADRAYIFARGFVNPEGLRDALHNEIKVSKDHIGVYPKPGDGINEILILLRNPYGGNIGAQNDSKSFERRIYDLISRASNYITSSKVDIILDSYPEITRNALENYFYGDSGLLKMLEVSRDRIAKGEKPGEEPFFSQELKIFEENEPIEVFVQTSGSEDEKIRSIVKQEVEKALRGTG